MKNKNGDVPITILVIGVFAVCSMALFSFYISGISGKETFLRVGIIEQTNSIANEIKFYKSSEIEKNPEELMDILKMKFGFSDLILEKRSQCFPCFTGLLHDKNIFKLKT